LFDMLGRRTEVLFEGDQAAGRYAVTLDGRSLSSGVYLYRLTMGAQSVARKCILLK